MGGCRCTFRNCTRNTSNSPGTHFFHFPYKDPERCRKWAKYSDNMHYMILPAARLRNKVVCETHFHDENFMNYKKERLIQQAVPTLVRLENGFVLDYEEDENPKPKFLNPTSLQHLVPPQSSQIRVELVAEVPERKTKPLEEIDGPQPAKMLKIGPPPRILNLAAPQNKSPLPRIYEPVVHQISIEDESPTFTLEAIAEDEVTEVDFERVMDEESIEPEDGAPELATEMMLKSVHEEQKFEFEKEIETLKADIASKDSELAILRQQVETLRADVALMEVKSNSSVTQVETITTSRKMESSASAPLTKAQLFNGIKKYLGPSMAAMVRMEMFGGPEREWKQDEKNVSVELLSLGEHVFDFVRDEWRCRLPPKRDVEQWLSQRGQLEEEEDL